MHSARVHWIQSHLCVPPYLSHLQQSTSTVSLTCNLCCRCNNYLRFLSATKHFTNKKCQVNYLLHLGTLQPLYSPWLLYVPVVLEILSSLEQRVPEVQVLPLDQLAQEVLQDRVHLRHLVVHARRWLQCLQAVQAALQHTHTTTE